MRKVLIFRNSGSGKSTLAIKLVNDEGLPHLDLDTIAWLPTASPERESLENSLVKIDQFTTLKNGWVIEGCYSDLLQLVSPMANEAVFLNLAIEQCVLTMQK